MRIGGTFLKAVAATVVAALLSFSTLGAAHAHAHDLPSGDDCATCRVVHGATVAAPPPGIALALVLRSEPVDEQHATAPATPARFVGAPRAPPFASN